MKEKADDYEFKEDTEIIEGDYQESLKKLTEYSNLLEKEGNLFIRFKKNKRLLNLKSNLSFFRICALGAIYPEENVLFTLYAINSDESESENENNNNKKGIDKLKERLIENEDNNKNKLRSKKRNKKNTLENSENIKKQSKEKEEKDSVILLDEVKSSVQSILHKEGNTIGKNFELYKLTWRNLYKWLLIFPLVILFGLLFFIYQDAYGFSFAEFFSFILIFIICSTSMSGNAKMLSKKRVNFKKENYLLYLIIVLSIYILACANARIEMAAYQFLSQYKAFTNITFSSLILLCIILVCLNERMIKFHIRYSKILESEVLLSDKF